MTPDRARTLGLKSAVFCLGILPFGVLAARAFTDALGANPIETITHFTGEWGLRILLATLVITPVRRITGWNRLARVRRMVGLFAFFYLSLHLATYLVLDQYFAWGDIWDDIVKRPYITMGVAGITLLVPLAITSTDGMLRRLGGRRWRRLHRMVYAAAMAGVIHFLWLVKADSREPLIYLAILLVLLILRLPALERWLPTLRAQPAR